MLQFYWSTFLRAFGILWTATDRYVTAIGIGAAVLTFFRPELAHLPLIHLPEFSRWWALLPLGLLFLYGLLRANYEQFREIEREKEGLDKRAATEEQRAALKELLAEAIREGRKLFEGNPSNEEAGAWGGKIKGLLVEAFTDSSEAEIFVSDEGLLPLDYGDTGAQSWIRRRLERLQDLLRRADSLQIRPGFNGRDYIVPD